MGKFMNIDRQFYEFFAGGGMANAGLGEEWSCLFANDFSDMKAKTYAQNWGSDHFKCGDVASVTTNELPGQPTLVWASFPCQDLSLAGKSKGLGDAAADVMTRSGTFWPFWALMVQLRAESRAPQMIVLENVLGTLSSRDGKDFAAICDALATGGYRFGAMVIDANHFVPQSRPRVFFIAVDASRDISRSLEGTGPHPVWHPSALCAAHEKLPASAAKEWVWWQMPVPPRRNIGFVDIIEEKPTGCRWHSKAETERLISMMTPLHVQKIEMAKASGRKQVGGVYKRTRVDAAGVKRQRAEVRFDDTAGCLRTPAGGSSRQSIIVVDGKSVRSRLLSPREAARLMGLEDTFKLPERYNDAYHVAGDGVCVPVVRYLAHHVLEPLIGREDRSAPPIAA